MMLENVHAVGALGGVLEVWVLDGWHGNEDWSWGNLNHTVMKACWIVDVVRLTKVV